MFDAQNVRNVWTQLHFLSRCSFDFFCFFAFSSSQIALISASFVHMCPSSSCSPFSFRGVKIAVLGKLFARSLRRTEVERARSGAPLTRLTPCPLLATSVASSGWTRRVEGRRLLQEGGGLSINDFSCGFMIVSGLFGFSQLVGFKRQVYADPDIST